MHSSARKLLFFTLLFLVGTPEILAAPPASASRIPDPMRPPFFTVASRRKTSVPYRLTSILIAPDRRIATINGQRLEPGDHLGDAIVLRIEPSRVILRLGTGGILILALYPTLLRSSSRSPR